MTVKGTRVIHCHGKNKGKTIKKHRTHKEALAHHRAIMANKARKSTRSSPPATAEDFERGYKKEKWPED